MFLFSYISFSVMKLFEIISPVEICKQNKWYFMRKLVVRNIYSTTVSITCFQITWYLVLAWSAVEIKNNQCCDSLVQNLSVKRFVKWPIILQNNHSNCSFVTMKILPVPEKCSRILPVSYFVRTTSIFHLVTMYYTSMFRIEFQLFSKNTRKREGAWAQKPIFGNNSVFSV